MRPENINSSLTGTVLQQGTWASQAQTQACSKAKSISSQGHSASRTGTRDTGDETRQTGPMAELKH